VCWGGAVSATLWYRVPKLASMIFRCVSRNLLISWRWPRMSVSDAFPAEDDPFRSRPACGAATAEGYSEAAGVWPLTPEDRSACATGDVASIRATATGAGGFCLFLPPGGTARPAVIIQVVGASEVGRVSSSSFANERALLTRPSNSL